MEINKDDIKEKIINYEMYTNGLRQISGAYIKVLNLKIRKYKYIADIIIYEDEKQERYNNCEYSKKAFL